MTTVVTPADNAPTTRRKRRQHRLADVLAECEWFADWTTDNTYAVALALGIKRESLHQAVVVRGDRRDLWRRLEARDVSLSPEEWCSKEWLPESDPRRQRDVTRCAARHAARREAGVPERRRRDDRRVA